MPFMKSPKRTLGMLRISSVLRLNVGNLPFRMFTKIERSLSLMRRSWKTRMHSWYQSLAYWSTSWHCLSEIWHMPWKTFAISLRLKE